MSYLSHLPLDWEPLQIVLQFQEGSQVPQDLVERDVVHWVRQRDEQGTCSCTLVFLDVSSEVDHARLLVERMCEACLPDLVQNLSQAFPNLLRVEAGVRPMEKRGARRPETEWVDVAGREVEFEDGRVESVSPFRISRFPVTIGEFRSVASVRGYVTDGEKSEEVADTYLINDGIAGTPADRVNSLPATRLSFRDASFYCEHTNCRLPTEAEWLAASLVDETIYSAKEAKQALHRVAEYANALQLLSNELTSTRTLNGLVIVRRGPKLLRDVNWKNKERSHRIPIAENVTDATIQFRTCSLVS